MTHRTLVGAGLLALALVVLTPAATLAQSGIAGQVRDNTSGVLPGVAVEATSPALIEGSRVVTTDGQGRYSIVDLRPGVYVVLFTLPGFSTIRREGIQLPASFTATVDVEMRVGGVEETIIVSGQSPAVDIQNVRRQEVLSNELLEALPSSRSPQGFVPFLPGVSGSVLGAFGRDTRSLSIHGGRTGESNVAIGGMRTGHIRGPGGAFDTFYVNQAIVEELSIQLGASSAEQQLGGIWTNVIPKEGGNSFSGFLFASYSGERLQADNLTEDLTARGLTRVGGIATLWDINPAVGGRIMRDKLWFYSSVRNAGSKNYIAGLYYNLTPKGWSYTPDLSRPAFVKIDDEDYNTRLTWQATPKNKISVFHDVQPHYVHQRNYGSSVSPEATTYAPFLPNYHSQVLWKSVASNRLLLEAGAMAFNTDLSLGRQKDPAVDFETVPALEQRTNMRIRAAAPTGDHAYGHHINSKFGLNASASYVTGSHAFKAGLQLERGTSIEIEDVNGSYGVTLLDGRPRSLTLVALPLTAENHLNANLGVFAQDNWTIDNLTLNLGLRWDYMNASVPAQQLAAGRFVPARSYTAVEDVPNWHDISPRLGASYDVFGDAKTALKVTLNRYVGGVGVGSITHANNPVNTAVTSVSRNWNDANGDFVPDCDLGNPLRNGECEQVSNLDFGKPNASTTRYDDDVLHGFAKRPYNWETSVALQREVFSGVSMEVAYFRRWYGNFTVTDNRAVTPADYDPFCITAPVDPRLPGGGGNQLCGLYDVTRAKFGRVDDVVTFAKNFGNQAEIYNGVDMTMTVRSLRGLQLSGGLNMGRTATDRCYVVDSPEQARPGFCDITPPFLTQVKFMTNYKLPWWDLQASAIFQNVPGPPLLATHVVGNSEVRLSLNRDLASGAGGTVTKDLIAPGSLYLPRANQIDLRVSKAIRVGPARLLASVDTFNLLNGSAIQSINTRYGPAWQQPSHPSGQPIQLARYVQFSTQLTW